MEGNALVDICSQFIGQSAHLFDLHSLIARLPKQEIQLIKQNCSAHALNCVHEIESTAIDQSDHNAATNVTQSDIDRLTTEDNNLWHRLFSLRWPNLSLSQSNRDHFTHYASDDEIRHDFRQLYWQRHVLDCMHFAFEYYSDNGENEESFFDVKVSPTILSRSYKTPNQYMVHLDHRMEQRKKCIDINEPGHRSYHRYQQFDHYNQQTIGQVIDMYGQFVHEIKLGNNAIEICSSNNIFRDMNERLSDINSVEFHDLRDASSISVIDYMIQCTNMKQLKMFHGFLSESAFNSLLFEMIKLSLLNRGASTSLLSSDLYASSIHTLYDQSVSIPPTMDNQTEEFDLYSDLFCEENEAGDSNVVESKRKRANEVYCEKMPKRMKLSTIDILNQLNTIAFYSTTMYVSSCELLGELLRHTKALRTLICSDNRLNEQSARFILSGLQEACTTNNIMIEELRITDNTISNNILPVLGAGMNQGAYLSGLKILDLSLSGISGGGLFSLLPNMDLEYLCLSYNELSDSACVELCRFLEADQYHKPININISNCELKQHHMANIFNSLASCNHVRSLVISCNDAYMQTAAIAKCLSINNTLEMLDIGYTLLTDISAQLEQALIQNSSLKILRLAQNKLGDAGAASIARVISNRVKNAVNSNKRACFDIDLSANRITNIGGLALLKAIAECESSTRIMEIFDLTDNHLSSDVVEEWQDHLSHNKSKIGWLLITNPSLNVGRYFEPCDGVTAT